MRQKSDVNEPLSSVELLSIFERRDRSRNDDDDAGQGRASCMFRWKARICSLVHLKWSAPGFERAWRRGSTLFAGCARVLARCALRAPSRKREARDQDDLGAARLPATVNNAPPRPPQSHLSKKKPPLLGWKECSPLQVGAHSLGVPSLVPICARARCVPARIRACLRVVLGRASSSWQSQSLHCLHSFNPYFDTKDSLAALIKQTRRTGRQAGILSFNPAGLVICAPSTAAPQNARIASYTS